MNDALTLARWLSPAFPIGSFSWSHGLEQAVADGLVQDADSLSDWIEDLLTRGSLRADATLLAAAWHQAEPLPDIDAEARAFAGSAQRLAETAEQGAAFCRTLRQCGGPELPDLTYPVAVGGAARAEALSLDMTLQMYLQAAASNLVSAAIRLSVLGQSAGQACLTRIEPAITSAANSAASGDLDDLSSSTIRSDMAAMAHETLQPRLFRS